ncbi:MAG: hypothetical protein ACN4GF_01845 [Lentimonas sp.]
MKKLLLPLVLFLGLFVCAQAQETIDVDRVNFKSLRDNWVQMEIQLKCGKNPDPQARNDRYVENIKVKAYLGYALKEKGKFDFYTSEVEIVVMEQGDDNNVYFYLPGLIVERDQLSSIDPDYYFVEVSVNDQLQPVSKKARSSKLREDSVLASMKSKADSEASSNEHILMPIYYAPAEFTGRVDKLPIFLRKDVRD